MAKLQAYDAEVRNMIADGESYSAIGRRFGASVRTVRTYCARHGCLQDKETVRKNRNTNPPNSKAYVKTVIETNNPEWEYIGGYVTNRSQITVKHIRCGRTKAARYDGLITNGCVCADCKRDEIAQRKAEARERKAQENKQKRLRREREKAQRKEDRKHPCAVCGAITSKRKYCSDKCARKADNKRREVKHRMRGAVVDKDITLMGLYTRDKGVCYLCGGVCDWNDYKVTEGTTICGDNYPSIDHVIPLSKGGKHAWANVRLAHRSCNTKKGATLSP